LLIKFEKKGGGRGKANLQANNSKNEDEGKYEKTTEKKKVFLRKFMYFDKASTILIYICC